MPETRQLNDTVQLVKDIAEYERQLPAMIRAAQGASAGAEILGRIALMQQRLADARRALTTAQGGWGRWPAAVASVAILAAIGGGAYLYTKPLPPPVSQGTELRTTCSSASH